MMFKAAEFKSAAAAFGGFALAFLMFSVGGLSALNLWKKSNFMKDVLFSAREQEMTDSSNAEIQTNADNDNNPKDKPEKPK